MATIAACESALHELARRLADADPARRKKADFERTLTCTLRDLQVTFAGQLHDARLTDIRQVDNRDAQIRMAMSSDDLIAMVAGQLSMASAWATGRVKIEAGVFDLLKLRALF
ncbi:MAG: SCP2 sterol-binding domain-containing protein [Jatrophihabitantaceae bacterium]